MTKKNKHLRDPHERVSELGDLTAIATLTTSKKYPKTCAAMDKVSKEESRDDQAKTSGEDDYSASLMKLLHAFDTFINERYKGKRTAGYYKNYNMKKPCHLTIYALWQIRHVQTHQGSVIDKDCKANYENILSKGRASKTQPAIDLPKILEENQEFILGFDDYKIVKECILSYIEAKISKKDYDIICKRSSFTNVRFSGMDVIMDYGFGVLAIDYEKAHKLGCKINPETKQFEYPCRATYNPEKETIMLENGEEIKVKVLEKRY